MLDIHSHILPNMDDGAKSTSEALTILKDLKLQGCTHVLATPHFYPEVNSFQEFTSKAAQSYSGLLESTKGLDLPVILPGCEVYYFNGLSTCDGLELLALNNSGFLLVEMPHKGTITNSVLDGLVDINLNRGMTPIIAHVERYSKFGNFKGLMELVTLGYVRAQINASSVIRRNYSNTCLSLIKNGLVSYVGSDAHSMNNRPVCFNKAFYIIEKRLGISYKNKLITNSITLIDEMGIDTIEK